MCFSFDIWQWQHRQAPSDNRLSLAASSSVSRALELSKLYTNVICCDNRCEFLTKFPQISAFHQNNRNEIRFNQVKPNRKHSEARLHSLKLRENRNKMSYRSGYGGGHSKNSASDSGGNGKGYSMNAVPPPSSLGNSRFGKFQKAGNLSTSTQSSTSTSGAAPTALSSGLSKHGYSTMNSIAQFATSSQYSLGKRKSKTEDE